MMNKLKLGLVQFAPEWEDPQTTITKLDIIIERRTEDPDLLILPEMSLTGFTMQSEKFAEELDGISTQYFMELSSKLKTHIFAGIIERDDDKIYNSLVHFNEEGLIAARYRKIHPFSYSKEDVYYNRGKETVITKIDNIKIGLSICYDLRFPELYRYYGKEKVDLLINIANWPVPRISHWELLLKARAIENLCYVCGVNRVGEDPHHKYPGHSSLVDPRGNVQITSEEEGILFGEIDQQEVQSIREEFPFITDIKLI